MYANENLIIPVLIINKVSASRHSKSVDKHSVNAQNLRTRRPHFQSYTQNLIELY